MRQKRFTVAAAELGGSIYATGGYDSEQYLATVERFDPREGCWYPVRQLPADRNFLDRCLVIFRAACRFTHHGIHAIIECHVKFSRILSSCS